MKEKINCFMSRFSSKLNKYKVNIHTFDNSLNDPFGILTRIDFEYKNIEGYVSFYSKGVINIEIFDYNTGSIIFNTLLMPEGDSTEAFNQFDKLI